MKDIDKYLGDIFTLFQRRNLYKSEEIEKIMGISSSEMKKIVEFVNTGNYGCEFRIIKGRGLSLIEIDKKLLQESLTEYNKQNEYVFELKEKFIINLITASDYLNVNQLLDKLYLSRPKLNKMIEDVSGELQLYDVSIDYVPYKGIKLLGSELDIRRFILNYDNFYSKIKENDLILSFFKIHNISIVKNRNLSQFKKIIEIFKMRVNNDNDLVDFYLEEEHEVINDLLTYLKLDVSKSERRYLSACYRYFIEENITDKELASIYRDYNNLIKNISPHYKIEEVDLFKDDIIRSLKYVYLQNKYNYLYMKEPDTANISFIDEILSYKFGQISMSYKNYNNVNFGYLSRLILMKHQEYYKYSTFKKIVLIKANTINKDEYHKYILQNNLNMNSQIELFSEHEIVAIQKFNPSLIITSHFIEEHLKKELKDFRIMNINRIYFDLSAEELKNYMLNYEYVKILNDEVIFSENKITDYILVNETLYYKIYLYNSEQEDVSVNIRNQEIYVPTKFIAKSINNLLFIDFIIDIIELNALDNLTEDDFKGIISNHMKNR